LYIQKNKEKELLSSLLFHLLYTVMSCWVMYILSSLVAVVMLYCFV